MNPQDSLYHDAKSMLGILTTASETVTLPLFDFFRSANEWDRQAVTWILQVHGAWKYDDSGYTTFPTAVATLVDSQDDYSLPTATLKIERVEVMNKDGNYQLITPIAKEWIRSEAISEFYETAGMPLYYRMEGNSIKLIPKPSSNDVTLVEGIKIYINRTINSFSLTDTATQPGFADTFHRIISVGAAYDFAQAKGMVTAIQLLANRLNSMKSDLQEFYSTRQSNIKNEIRILREGTI